MPTEKTDPGADRNRTIAAAVEPVRTGVARGPIVPILVVAGLILGGVAVYAGFVGFGGSDAHGGALSYEVRRSPLQVTVTADGNVESASNIEVKCRVTGGSTILWIVEDGKIVEEGEEIVRLDTSAIDDKLNSQRIVYEKALATHIQAEQDLEAAKIAVKEYEEGTFLEQLKQMEADIQIALENLRSAENQLKHSRRMVRKGFVSSLQRDADEFAVERANLDLDVARTRKKVLVEFTREKTLKQLVATREATAARLRSEQASLQLEKDRLDRLETQSKHCVIKAPKKGMVVYANDAGRNRFRGGEQGDVEEGAMVRESQALVRLPDLSQMQVKVTVHESRVDQVRPGMPARIIIQDQEYAGRVLSIANQPERTSWYSANIKEYATIVTIPGETSGLKPGMTAKVTILIDDLSDALSVPVSAVVQQRGEFYCWVKTPGGPERRPLVIGRTNDKLIEVVDGVKEGEAVFRNPRAVTEEARHEPPFEEQSEVTRFAAGSEEATSPPGAASAPEESPSRSTRTDGAGGDREGGGSPRSERGAGRRSGRGSFNLMQYDQDGDGKLASDELPERMRGFFDRMDPNGDGFIDSSEIAAMRRGREGGGGPGRGADGGESRRSRDGGERGGDSQRRRTRE